LLPFGSVAVALLPVRFSPIFFLGLVLGILLSPDHRTNIPPFSPLLPQAFFSMDCAQISEYYFRNVMMVSRLLLLASLGGVLVGFFRGAPPFQTHPR
jgi:hypothetical protein